MRHGWEIKKLGEVCTFRRGLTYTKGDEVEFSENCVLRSNNIDLDTMSIVLDDLKCVRKDLAIGEDKIVKPNTILVCMSNGSKQHIGKVAFIDREYGYAFGGFMGLIIPQSILPKYVYYSCLSPSYKHFLRGIGNGANITNLKFSNLSNYTIPVPPLSEQERIVAELDLLSDVIAKKREQLKQLDTLAQSIFYDMFGDPITNEKGWKTKKLGETSTLHNGRAFKPTDWSNSGLPIVRIQNLNNPTLPFNYYDGEVANNHRLYGGELLYAWSGTPDTSFGAHIWYGGDAVLNQHIFKIEYNKDLLNIKYFVFNLNGIVNSMFDKTHGGVGLQHITKGTLTSQNICLPPLYLQQQFASMIESIEKQKELIKQSLSEVQQLFDSRMDYYFG